MAKNKTEIDLSTEEKIKEVARKVFTQNGFAATRTRDIAQQAGVNIALLNYYFRSKENLYEIIFLEELQRFFGIIHKLVIDETTDLEAKLEIVVDNYMDILSQNPELPLFVLSEIQKNPQRIQERAPIKEILKNSSLIKQFKKINPEVDAIQFIYSFLGMVIFPYLSKPIIAPFLDKDFQKLMNERKPLVIKWLKMMLGV
ncbi:MAG: TetR/AcrR family transcriptional regulator [Capnocytophaga sp.]|nr:TetR/AcrR family transcriptional regulator [Capnocytophaga sp.]